MYLEFIEYLLNELELEYDSIEREGGGDYIICQNLICQDVHKSMQIYPDNGFCLSHNMMIDDSNRVHLKAICKEIGYLKEYIEYVMKINNIPSYYFNQYKNTLISRNLNENYNYKSYKKYRDVFMDLYIGQSDILLCDEIKPTNKEKFKVDKKKKKKSSILEVELNDKEHQQCEEYIKGRKLVFNDNIYPTKLRFQSGFEVLGIGIKYKNGFIKYRLLQEGFKYVSQGTYKELYEAQITNNNKLCIIQEGEFESESFKKYCSDYSIYALHNCNSINDLTKIEKYDRILVLLDADKYYVNRNGIRKKIKSIFPNKKVNILKKIGKSKTKELCKKYKIEFNKLDYNYLLMKDELELKSVVNDILNKIGE